jgi:cobalt-zinc-cadmium efflux system outer membrane protein
VSGELPLFNRNEGPIAAAEARRAQQAAKLSALQAQIIGALDAAAGRYRSASRALASADTLVAEARRREGELRRLFDAGGLDRPSLVEAQIELATARIAALDARAAERRAVASLEDALRAPLFGSRGALPVEERNPRIVSEKPR